MISRTKGFSLVELLITVVVSSLLLSLLINTFSSQMKSKLSSQRRLEISIQSNNLSLWFNQLFSQLKQYNFHDTDNKAIENKTVEQRLIEQHPILFGSKPLANVTLFSKDDRQSDRLAIFYQGRKGCNGQSFEYAKRELWLVVDEIYLQQGSLRCKSHDARYLLGMSNKPYSSRSVSLMQGLSDLQIKYLAIQEGAVSWLDAESINTEHVIKAVRVFISLNAKQLLQKQTHPAFFTLFVDEP